MKRKHCNREFFRVDAHIPLMSRLVPHDEIKGVRSYMPAEDTRSPFNKKSLKKVDIGGGGISFDTTERYDHGAVIEIKMLLEKVHEGIIVVYGEVVRSEPVSHLHCRVAVKFVSLNEQIRGIITRFVFVREREILAEKRVGWL